MGELVNFFRCRFPRTQVLEGSTIIFYFSVSMDKPIIVWRFRDGKRGHESQTQGFLQALGRLRAIESSDIMVTPGLLGSLHAAFGHLLRSDSLPDPDLLIGAGHGTHLPLLLGAHARGGRTIVLMKPSLPIRWFDLCVIPTHDDVRPRNNVFTTRGVLNPMAHNPGRRSERGLFLIGGPSRHHGWDEDALFRQIDTIVTRESGIPWIATTSRRTPQATARALVGRKWENLHPIPYSDTPDGWLSGQLQEASAAWVTEDSVSMIYEALTAGTPTGVLSIPRRVVSRLSLGVDRLAADGLVTTFSTWRDHAILPYAPNEFSSGKFFLGGASSGQFNEATRCARWMVDRWFTNR
uniref:Fission protein ELM1 n=1 Tax=Candidatus Kentrum sp. FW TaxID=2126338 RepID=A0A450TB16_9GAMM|nr:MAG: hypothetical protein BECKFW1821C_GA0114237_100511 [Candidatus Kentron sp. FW]